MTIEFNCPSCSKVLKTADDKAGLSAKCPGCGQVLVVPASKSEAFRPEPEPEGKDGWDDWSENEGQAADKEEFAPPQRKKRPCPMCGQEIMAAARLCRHCGERFDDGKSVPAGSGKFAPTTIEAGEVLSVAWGIYKENIGMAIVGMIVPGAISFLVSLLIGGALGLLMVLMSQQGLNPNDLEPMSSIVNQLVGWIIGTYFGLGQAIFYVKMCRGDEPTVGDLFAGGKFYLRGLGAAFLVFLMVMLGFLAVCIGAIIVALVMSPYLYYLTDRDEGVFDTLSGTYKLTWPNLGSVFVLALANFGIVVAGVLALCVGSIVAVPFTSVITATAYLMMSGQLNARTNDLA